MSERREPLCFSRWDLFGGFALVGLLLAWTALVSRLPLKVPTHFDFAGRPNAWTDRRTMPWLVFGLPVGVWLLFWLLDLAMLGADEESAAKMISIRPLRGLMTLGMAGIGLAMVLIPLHGLWILGAALCFLFACLGVGIWESVLRVRILAPVEDEACYVWGIFYVNSQDERIWIPKRMGIGWTLNFGRPAGWLMLALLVLAPLLLLIAFR